MSGFDRRNKYTRAVWRRSYHNHLALQEDERHALASAVAALLEHLRSLQTEAALVAAYWEQGDPPGRVLKAHLPAGFDDEALLDLEEACFWMRLRELCCGD